MKAIIYKQISLLCFAVLIIMATNYSVAVNDEISDDASYGTFTSTIYNDGSSNCGVLADLPRIGEYANAWGRELISSLRLFTH